MRTFAPAKFALGPRRMKNIRWGERRQWSHQPISGVVWFIAIRLPNATRTFALEIEIPLFLFLLYSTW